MTTLTANTGRTATATGARLRLQTAGGDRSIASRRWSALAYSGGVFAQFWHPRCIIDLDTLKLPPAGKSLPSRLNHETSRDPNQSTRVGFADTITRTRRGIEAAGGFLDNPVSAKIVGDADGGFPWQVSIIALGPWYDATPGEVINGVTLDSDHRVMRNAAIRAIDFVEVGADYDADAMMLSGNSVGALRLDQLKRHANGNLEIPSLTGNPDEDWKQSATLRAYWHSAMPTATTDQVRDAFLGYARMTKADGDDYSVVPPLD